MATFIKNVESLDEVESDADERPILDRTSSHRPDKPTSSDNSSSSEDDLMPPPHSAPKLSQ